MKVSEAFLVNTKNFDSIIDTLVKYEAKEPVINSSLLEDLCFSDPNDLLVVRILKDFKIIDNEGKPSVNYEEFQNPQTTKAALAKGLVSAYEGLFDQYPKIHQASNEKIREAFEEIFKEKKTELIIKYISGTFHKIASYVGISTIDMVLNGLSTTEGELETSTVGTVKSSNNGVQSSTKTTPTIEEISDSSIDDFVNDLDAEETEDEDPSSDKEADLTIQEFVKNDMKEDEVEDDPFDFGSTEEPFEEPEVQTTTEKMDVNPVDLDIPLSTATKNQNSMEHLTAEHEFVQKALLRKSDLLRKMNRWEDLVPTLEEIIKRYDNEEHNDLSDLVARSIIRRATALLKLNKTEEALAALNTVISRFENSENKEFYDQASRAMLYKVTILEKKGGNNLLPLYNSVIDRLESNSELLMKEKLDEIHLKRFDLITKEGESSEILDASTKLINRFGDSDEHHEYLQKAMIIRAETLDSMGKDEEALAAYDKFLAVFSN